jgi:hypothetical protein
MKNVHIIPEPKQETLEETAERLYPISKGGSMWMPSRDDYNKAVYREKFVEGAKWMQERMYSEEDLRLAWKDGREFEYDHNGGEGGEFTGAESFDEWFEQFKKK